MKIFQSQPASIINRAEKKVISKDNQVNGFSVLSNSAGVEHVRQFVVGRFNFKLCFQQKFGDLNLYSFSFRLDGKNLINPILNLEPEERIELKRNLKIAFEDFAKINPLGKIIIRGSDAAYELEDYQNLEDLYKSRYETLKGKKIDIEEDVSVEFKEDRVVFIDKMNICELLPKDFSILFREVSESGEDVEFLMHNILNILTQSKKGSERKSKQRLLAYYKILSELFGDAVEGVEVLESEKFPNKFKFKIENDKEYFFVRLDKIPKQSI